MKTFEKNELFVHPFTALVAGPTGSGKTVFVSKILESHEKYIKPKIDKIIYCYSIWQPQFEVLKKSNIEFYEGIYDITNLNSQFNNLLILDDLMREASGNEQILDMFTKGSHHKNTSVMLLTQNIFSKGKHSRTISLNSHYIVMFKNPRDRSQISFLARQMYPQQSKFLEEAYLDATNNPHGFLFIDLKQTTPNELRIQTNVFSKTIFYVPK
jgi:hypothetical protein